MQHRCGTLLKYELLIRQGLRMHHLMRIYLDHQWETRSTNGTAQIVWQALCLVGFIVPVCILLEALPACSGSGAVCFTQIDYRLWGDGRRLSICPIGA